MDHLALRLKLSAALTAINYDDPPSCSCEPCCLLYLQKFNNQKRNILLMDRNGDALLAPLSSVFLSVDEKQKK